jgi:hypothetical protein
MSQIRRALLLKPCRNVAFELIGDTTAAGRRSNKILPTEDVISILTAVLEAVKVQETERASAVDEDDDASFISGFAAANLSESSTSTVKPAKVKGKEITVRVQDTNGREQAIRMNESDTIIDLEQAYARVTNQRIYEFGFTHKQGRVGADLPFTLKEVGISTTDSSPILTTVTAWYRQPVHRPCDQSQGSCSDWKRTYISQLGGQCFVQVEFIQKR